MQNQILGFGPQCRNLADFFGTVMCYGPWCKTKSFIVAHGTSPKLALWPKAFTKSCTVAYGGDQIFYGIIYYSNYNIA
jgi:hypothetical protein